MGHDFPVSTTANIRRVLIITLFLNVAVAAAKIIYGVLTNAISIMSDGFHSMFDGVSNVLGLIGIWIASHPPDEKHPYGHRKFETLFTIIVSFMIFATSIQILKKTYLSFTSAPDTRVTTASFVIMIITLIINIFVSRYESDQGKKLKSDFLVADAMHTKSDILASCAVITGLFLVRMGYPLADGIVGLIITFFIARIGYDILKKATDTLVDTVCINTALISSVVMRVDGVRQCTDIRTRGSENQIYLDLRIGVAPDMTTGDAHDIADRAEGTLKKEFPSVVDVVVHIEPEKKK